MASAATRRASSTSGQVRGGGLVLFAFLMLRSLAAFNLIYGIAAVANPHVFIANAHYVFADLRTLGWITLIIGALQLLAAAGSWRATSWPAGSAWRCWGLNAIDMMFFLAAYPFWALVVIAADLVALYGLCVHGSRANLEAA